MSGRSGWSPFLSSSTRDIEDSDRYLAREVEALEKTLREQGALSRRELGRRVGARPGPRGPLRAGAADGGPRRAHPAAAARAVRPADVAATALSGHGVRPGRQS